jgi:hypothetical protein
MLGIEPQAQEPAAPPPPASEAPIAPEPPQREAAAAPDTGQNVPETDATLHAQQEQLVRGERPVQMFPQGTAELPLPKGMDRVETPRGVFHFNPGQVSAEQIKALSAAGRENELLGLGPVSKPEATARAAAGEPPVAVVERQPDGTEVRAAAGTAQTAPAQQAAMEGAKSPDDTVDVEAPGEVLEDRGTKAKDAGAGGRAKAASRGCARNATSH